MRRLMHFSRTGAAISALVLCAQPFATAVHLLGVGGGHRHTMSGATGHVIDVNPEARAVGLPSADTSLWRTPSLVDSELEECATTRALRAELSRLPLLIPFCPCNHEAEPVPPAGLHGDEVLDRAPKHGPPSVL